jgi:hypothetical protein
VQVEALEREEREEEVTLFAGDEGEEARALGGILLLEGDGVFLDVGVFADLVGVAVVTRVLRHPPGVADADDSGCEEAAELVVGGARLEHLAVGGLVGEERELREDDSECARDEQLVPGVTEKDEPGHATGECDGESGHDGNVITAGAAQEACVTHCLEKRGVGARHVGG